LFGTNLNLGFLGETYMAAGHAQIKFGTDGWRGIIADDFTVANVQLATQAVCNWIKRNGNAPAGMVIGYDCRAQSDVFATAVAQVAIGNGIGVQLSNRPCSSPTVSFAVERSKAAVGIMITASHNPPSFNGLKIKATYGGSATPDIIKQIEAELALITSDDINVDKQSIETVDLIADYLVQCASLVDLELIRTSGFRPVIDPMHGSGSGMLTKILVDAGIDSIEIRSERNPYFGGVNPEPIASNMQALFDAVTESGRDVGICLDGDADRFGACDSHGRFVDCHRLFAVLLKHLTNYRGLTGDVVRTVSTTRALDKLCAKRGIRLIETPIGFKYICDLMLQGDVMIGGEESGGIGVKGHLPERDGVVMGLLILEAMAAAGKRLEDLIDDVFAEVGPHEYTRNDMHPPVAAMPAINAALLSFGETSFAGLAIHEIVRKDGTRLDFADGSWLLLRPSGTEPVVRVYAEAPTMDQAKHLVEQGVAYVNAVGATV
jgi:phosphomannomutase